MGSRGVLTKRQRQILIGTLLGDAHLELNGKYVRLRVDHYNPQKDYIFWMASEFEPFALTPRSISRVDKRNGKAYTRWHFSTKSLPILSEFRNMFYKEGKKIVPLNISEMIDSLSLAIWYMDDGFRRRDCKGFYLCSSSFTHEEQSILQRMLLERFGLESRVHHQRELERIFIPSAFSDRFNNLVKRFVLPTLSYKLL